MSQIAHGSIKSPSKFEPIRSYFSSQLIPLSVLFLIIVIASLLSPFFLTSANISNLLLQVAVNMVVSMGMFMVILSGGVDLSVGSILAVCGVLVAGLLRTFSMGTAIVLTILIGIGLGTVNGLVVSKLKVAPFIVTLGMMSFARGVAYWYTGAVSIIWSSFPNVQLFSLLGGGRVLGFVPIPAIIWAALAVLAFVIIRYTVFGRVLYAIGGNEESARLSGINTLRYKIFPYAYSGFCCAIAGILLTSRLGVGSPLSGVGLELDSIAAVVIGGTRLSGGEGRISGVVIGVFILGIINNILDLMNVPSHPQQMLKGAIIVAAVILSSQRMKKSRRTL